jgi:hypothetical protein
MSTNAGAVGVSTRPALIKAWTAAVSALAVAALIMSTVALSLAVRDDRQVSSRAEQAGGAQAVSAGAIAWDAGKLEAMEGRQLAETVRTASPAPLWDAQKLEAMEGRQLAETVRITATVPLWDTQKLEAMEGRQLAG